MITYVHALWVLNGYILSNMHINTTCSYSTTEKEITKSLNDFI